MHLCLVMRQGCCAVPCTWDQTDDGTDWWLAVCRRIGKGATMYYPVQVAGALLSAGDTHAAMGDSELDGTGEAALLRLRSGTRWTCVADLQALPV